MRKDNGITQLKHGVGTQNGRRSRSGERILYAGVIAGRDTSRDFKRSSWNIGWGPRRSGSGCRSVYRDHYTGRQEQPDQCQNGRPPYPSKHSLRMATLIKVQTRLIEIGGGLVRNARRLVFQLAE